MFGDLARAFFQRPVTERYPFVRRLPPERLRGRLRWQQARCTGCAMCVRDCPAFALEMFVIDKAKKRFVMRYHIDRCTFCAQCVVSCNFNALELPADEWELAAPGREAFRSTYGEEEDVAAVLARESAPDAGSPAPR
jgi:formate hydrogenlyase subunit 6/NADH:ubiquinone oxidoreductase subunit I